MTDRVLRAAFGCNWEMYIQQLQSTPTPLRLGFVDGVVCAQGTHLETEH